MLAATTVLLVTAVTTAVGPMPFGAGASSHREAPLISLDPAADNTDLYAFVSPDKPSTVTIIANWIPLEEPNGGPNFNNFDDSALYEIKIDNSGDAVADITYQFVFTSRVRNPETWLYNTGPITGLGDSDRNYRQFYWVYRIENGRSRLLKKNLHVVPASIGPRSTPSYTALARRGVYSLGGGRQVFAGPVDDPFYVDLGSIFDLAGLRPFNNLHLIPLGPAPGVDGLGGYNTHTIALQVPITDLTRGHTRPDSPTDSNAVIGIWATTSRRATTVLRSDGTNSASGDWVQVSRLGNPLVNEVIIPLGKKDLWNRSQPAADAQFEEYYTSPSLAAIVNLVYPALADAPTTNRDDLVQVLLTGILGLNFTGSTRADTLRLNVAIPPTPRSSASFSRLGAAGGNLDGFPNGRRLEDDVTDIELRAVACGYGDFLNNLLGLCNLSPNNQVGDGVDANDRPFRGSFPYLASPWEGYQSTHQGGEAHP